MSSSPRRHLPRLDNSYYKAFAAVHWTITLKNRQTGWLSDIFHAKFRELLLHAANRQSVWSPTYCLMPDHIHLIWLGLKLSSDQLKSMRFLREHLQKHLEQSALGNKTWKLQKQSHDHVLRDEDRKRDAFARLCFYVLDNPVRAELVTQLSRWPYLGAMIPGYPSLHPLDDNYWEVFWKLYYRNRDPQPSETARTALSAHPPVAASRESAELL